MSVASHSGPSRVRERLATWIGAGSALFVANVLHRAGTMVFQFAVGHAGGVEAVGVMSSALAMAWVGGSFGGLGLPDRAMYTAALDETDPTLRPAHGLFLAVTAGSAVAVGAAAAILAPDVGPLLPLALVAGAFTQHAGAFLFSALRGMSRPRLEAIAWSASSLLLLAVSGLSFLEPRLSVLAGAFVASGVCVLAVAAMGSRAHRPLAPRMPTLRGAVREVRTSGSYFLVGAGGMLLGSADLIGAQLWLDSARVGALHAGTLVLRAALAAPWFFSVLALKARPGRRRPGLPALVASAVTVWAIASVAAWIAVPWIARGYDIDPALFRPVTLVAIAVSLPAYLATTLLPRAVMRHRRGTVRVFVLLGIFAPGAFWLAARAGDVTGLQLAHAGGYLLLAAAFVGLRLRGRKRSPSPDEPAPDEPAPDEA